jgi:hypothetical protein
VDLRASYGLTGTQTRSLMSLVSVDQHYRWHRLSIAFQTQGKSSSANVVVHARGAELLEPRELGTTQPRVSALMKGAWRDFSADMLLVLAGRLGLRLTLKLAA